MNIYLKRPRKYLPGILIGLLFSSPTSSRADDDLNGNGLPDDWESAHGWFVTPGVIEPGHGANDDPDIDGITNQQEFSLGLDPTAWNDAAGYLTPASVLMDFESESIGPSVGLKNGYYAIGDVSMINASAFGQGHAVKLSNGTDALTTFGIRISGGEYLDFKVKTNLGGSSPQGLSLVVCGTVIALNSQPLNMCYWSDVHGQPCSGLLTGTGGFDRVTIKHDADRAICRVLFNGTPAFEVPAYDGVAGCHFLYAGSGDYWLDDFACSPGPPVGIPPPGIHVGARP